MSRRHETFSSALDQLQGCWPLRTHHREGTAEVWRRCSQQLSSSRADTLWTGSVPVTPLDPLLLGGSGTVPYSPLNPQYQQVPGTEQVLCNCVLNV